MRRLLSDTDSSGRLVPVTRPALPPRARLLALAAATLLALATPGLATALGADASHPSVVRDGTWFVRESHSEGPATASWTFGQASDVPFHGDWDGDGTATPGVYRDGAWYLDNDRAGGSADISFRYGGRDGDLPVVGDWDGDGIDTVGVIRGGTWHLVNTFRGGAADVAFTYGRVAPRGDDIPLVGDWDGDGTDTVGIVREGTWYLRDTNTAGRGEVVFVYGQVGPRGDDIAVAGDWDGDGTDTVGIVRDNVWHLRDTNAAGPADTTYSFGAPSDWKAVVGGLAEPTQRRILEQPAADPLATAGTLRRGDEGDAVVALQERLLALGYWLPAAHGTFGADTHHAVVALQKAAGLGRDGVVDAATRRALDEGVRPRPRSTSGTVIEVDRAAQLLLLVTDGELRWTFDTATGREGWTTPAGWFSIFRQIDGYRHAPLGTLYRPKYFNGGIALHGYPSVPPYPASHGCVRVTNAAMDWLWANDAAPIGRTVWVY